MSSASSCARLTALLRFVVSRATSPVLSLSQLWQFSRVYPAFLKSRNAGCIPSLPNRATALSSAGR